jgi:ABC-type nickel/cobalt efflux system permease component RcnA
MADKDAIDYGLLDGVCPYHGKRDVVIEALTHNVKRIMSRLLILTITSAIQCVLLIGLCVLMYGLIFGAEGMKRAPVMVHATLERVR